MASRFQNFDGNFATKRNGMLFRSITGREKNRLPGARGQVLAPN